MIKGGEGWWKVEEGGIVMLLAYTTVTTTKLTTVHVYITCVYVCLYTRSLPCPPARPLRHCDPGFGTQPSGNSQAQLAVKLILSRVRH